MDMPEQTTAISEHAERWYLLLLDKIKEDPFVAAAVFVAFVLGATLVIHGWPKFMIRGGDRK